MNIASKTIMIAGYYGFGNTGDEAILAAMVQDLRGILQNVEIVVVSGDPKSTKKSHQVSAVSWNNVPQIIKRMTGCDLVILGGGGLFHDYWGFDRASLLTLNHTGIAFYASIALIASISSKPLVLYAVGIGPLLSEAGKFYTRAIAEQAALITVRDAESKQLLHSLGVEIEGVHITTDPAFGFEFSPFLLETKFDNRPILGVSLRNWDVAVNPDYWESKVAEALDHFLDLYAGYAIFIPFQEREEALLDDLAVSKRVQVRMRNAEKTLFIDDAQTPAEKAGLIAHCDLLLGMRLHSLIFAIKNHVPVVGLIYDPKVKNIMAQADMEDYTVELNELSSQALVGRLDDAYRDREKLTDQMRKVCFQLDVKALQNSQLAIDVLRQPQPAQHHMRPDAVDLLKQSALSLAQSFAEKQEQADLLAENIRDLRARHDYLENELKEHAEEIEELKAQLQRESEWRDQVIASLQLDISKLNHELTQRDQIIADSQAELENLTVAYNHAIHTHDMQIKEKKKQIDELNSRIAERDSSITSLNARVEERDSSIYFLDSQLAEIKGSRGWKLLWALWQIRLSLIPHGSQRERLLRNLLDKPKLRMSLPAFAFDSYKRARNAVYPSDLHAICTPSQKDLVSIVLPVYNGADLVSEAIDSVLSQSYGNFELILINDGSQDRTGEILDDYARRDRRIRVVHQENQKLPRALSYGFRMAQGEYLTWTSHDNRFKVGSIAKMVECLQRHPEMDMVYANFDIIGENGAPLRGSDWYAGYQQPAGSEHIYLPKDTVELNTWPNNFIGGAFLYRARVAWLLGDYSAMRYTREDYDYWMRVNSLLTLIHTDFDEPIYEYRFHAGSLTHLDEELGITQHRKDLMIFDDFRRDFFLTPLVWIIDVGESTPRAQALIDTLKTYIFGAEHSVVKLENLDPAKQPRLWTPYQYLKIITHPTAVSSPDIELPRNTFKVLLSLSDENLPKNPAEEWDICLALGSEAPAPRTKWDRQGWLVSEDIAALFTAIDIRVRSRHIELIEAEIAQVRQAQYKLSVIICTHQPEQSLVDVLTAIADQSLPQKDYEVLVVNNNPLEVNIVALIDEIRAEKFRKYPDHLKLLSCPILGLSHARNAGISEARGEIILFLDDDSIAEHDLLEHYVEAFIENPDAGVIGGHIMVNLPGQLHIPWKTEWARYWSQWITGNTQFTVVHDWWEFPWGANWCARREALLRIGGFRSKYGRRGTDFSGGEEIVAASLIKKLGYQVAILPQANVIHQVEPRRFTLEHLKHTLRSGLFVQYQAQMALHLPVETTIGSSFRQIGSSLLKLAAMFHPKNASRKTDLIEAQYYISARWRLLWRQIQDNFRRMRRPVTRSKV